MSNFVVSALPNVTMETLINVTLHNVSMEKELPSILSTSMGAALMMVFFVEGFLGNLWILFSILFYRKMWKVINIFIMSLCVNDLLSLSLIVVLIIQSYIWREWMAGDIMCKLNPEFTVAFIGSSLWHTALIAIHRYIVVVHNQLYKKMTKRYYVIFVLVMARLIPVACTVPGFSLDTSGYMAKMLRCILLPAEKGRIISITIVQILVPCLIVVICYMAIFGFVNRTTRRLQVPNVSLKREIQITKMFGIIFMMILVGFIPYSAMRNADRDNLFSADLYVMVSVFYGVATCSSPLVYGVMSRDIREASLRLLYRVMAALKLQKCLGMRDSYLQPTDVEMSTKAEMVTLTDTKTQTDL